MSFLTRNQLESIGFKHVGQGVLLSEKASIHNPSSIEIGDYSRIDDFCVLSAGEGGISIGRNVHIAVFCCLIGAGRIELQNFSNISSRVSIYSSNDDYSGEAMTNPTVPARFTKVSKSPVTLAKHVILGSGSVVLPGVRMAEGAVVGALSLVKEDCEAFGIYGGVPARLLGRRSNHLQRVEEDFLRSQNASPTI